MTRLWRAVLVLAGLAVVGVGALVVTNPLLGVIVSAEATGQGYGHPKYPPPIAAGYDLRANVTDEAAKSRTWTEVLRKDFPPGFSVASMQTALHEQGFHIMQARNRAGFEWGGMPCLYTLTVYWTEAAGRLETIQGGASSGCL